MTRTPVPRRPHRPPRRGRLVALLAATALALATGLAAAAAPAAGAASAPPVITISPTTTGTSLTQASRGLSFEASDLALPGFTGGDLAAYLDTISPSSVMRIGGNTVDETFWTSTGEAAPSWAIAHDHPGGPDGAGRAGQGQRLEGDPGRQPQAVRPGGGRNEASTRRRRSARSLQAIEIGNEPNLYSQYESDPSQYLTDFAAYVSAIEQAAPGVPIEGTDAAGAPDGSFQQAFVTAAGSSPGTAGQGTDEPLLPADQQHLRRQPDDRGPARHRRYATTRSRRPTRRWRRPRRWACPR